MYVETTRLRFFFDLILRAVRDFFVRFFFTLIRLLNLHKCEGIFLLLMIENIGIFHFEFRIQNGTVFLFFFFHVIFDTTLFLPDSDLRFNVGVGVYVSHGLHQIVILKFIISDIEKELRSFSFTLTFYL